MADEQKYPCPDCRCCQWCSEDRCRLCLEQKHCRRRKRSFAEQIAHFEALTQEDDDKSGQGR